MSDERQIEPADPVPYYEAELAKLRAQKKDDNEFLRELILAIFDHVDARLNDFDEITVRDLRELLEAHNSEWDQREKRLRDTHRETERRLDKLEVKLCRYRTAFRVNALWWLPVGHEQVDAAIMEIENGK